MPRRMTIAPHLTEEELYQRYRHSNEARLRNHYGMIYQNTVFFSHYSIYFCKKFCFLTKFFSLEYPFLSKDL